VTPFWVYRLQANSLIWDYSLFNQKQREKEWADWQSTPWRKSFGW